MLSFVCVQLRQEYSPLATPLCFVWRRANISNDKFKNSSSYSSSNGRREGTSVPTVLLSATSLLTSNEFYSMLLTKVHSSADLMCFGTATNLCAAVSGLFAVGALAQCC